MTKTTVYIPCSAEHFYSQNHEAVIDGYMTGEVIPDEIIFNINTEPCQENEGYKPPAIYKVGRINEYFIKNYKGTELNFFDRGSISKGAKMNDLTNGNIRFIGDIVIVHDADDLPHPLRVKTIRDAFDSNPEAIILNHNFWPLRYIRELGLSCLLKLTKTLSETARIYQSDSVYQYTKDNPLCVYGQNLGFNVGDGFMALRRYTLEKYKFLETGERGGDGEYCKRVLLAENRSIISDLPMYFYFK